MVETPGARTLIADFLTFGRSQTAAALALITAGALLEGAGVLMLVPIVSLILDSAGGAGGGLGAPVFTSLGLDTTAERIIGVLAGFAVLLVLRFFVLLSRGDLLNRLQQDFVADLRARAFRRLAQAPWAKVARLRQDPIGHALTRDIDRVAGGVGQLVSGGIAAVMLTVQLVLALALAPEVTVIVALLGVGIFRGLRWLRDRAENRGAAMTAEDLNLFQTVGGFLRGLKPAKAHGLEAGYVAAFEGAARRVAENWRAHAFDYSLAALALQTASGGIAIVAILLGVFVLQTPPDNLIVTLIILARLYGPLQAIQNTVQSVRHAVPGYRMARKIAGAAVDDVVLADAEPVEPLESAPEITLSAVSWLGGDDSAVPVLDGVTARIPAGQVTALIGRSGAGKSTLCDMSVGLLGPSGGEVLLDGKALDTELSARLRASVAYVGQEPFLFEDSLRLNLCWGCPPVTDEVIWDALETVGAAGIARGLDGELDGRIRVEGMRFSGGERQRLRLARALLRRPRLLVLDEATNALDPDAEAEVLRAVLAARGGATVLIVSHRVANLRLADHVILLESGKLHETGAVDSLLRDPASKVSAVYARPASRLVPDPATELHRKSDISTNSGVD
jgi:ABC-type multidrug transport system fused ATPase/permease subunit